MVSNILFLVSVCLVCFGYIYVFVQFLTTSSISDKTSFDVAKEISDGGDSINIVSSSDVIFSEYDVKRNVIRLKSKVYDSSKVSDIANGAMLAGYSLVNQECSDYFKFSFIISRINLFGFVGLLGVVLSYFIRNIGDAYIGIVIFGIMIIYQYMRYQISVLADGKIKEILDWNIYSKLSRNISSVVLFNKVSFIVMLILVIRLVVIILGM